MPKKDIPLFILASIILLISVIAIKLETDFLAIRENRENLLATAKLAVPSERIVNTSKENTLLLDFAKESKNNSYATKTVSGRILVTHVDKEKPDGEEVARKVLLVSNDGVYKIENLSGAPITEKLNGINLEITGLVLPVDRKSEKTLITNFSQADTRTLRPVSNIKRNYSENRESVCGASFCALVIPVSYSDDLPNFSKEQISDYIFNARIKNILSEESYNTLNYGGVVTDFIRISGGDLNLWSAPTEVSNYLNTHNINPASFDQIVFLVNSGSQSFGGLSSIGPTSFYISGAYDYLPVAIVGMASFPSRDDLLMANGNMSYFDYLYVHETGHNLGALHDNLLNCKSGPTSLPSECLFTEYGNNFSVMGGGALAGHFSFWNKMRIGWLSNSNVLESISGIHLLNPIETPNPLILGLDYGGDGTPNYAFEKRASVGIDTKNLFQDVNIDGSLVYRLSPDFGFGSVTSSPFSWNMELVDTTPPSVSSGWPISLHDAVLKNPQSFTDIGMAKGFRQPVGASSNAVEIFSSLAVNNSCVKHPIKVFEIPNTNDTFPGQVGLQKWGGGGLTLPAVLKGQQATPVNISADTSDSSSQVLVYKSVIIFNDDTLSCPPSDYTFKLKSNGVDLPLLTETSAQYPAWGGPYYETLFAYVPTYGIAYGPKHVTLEITKQNDNTTFSKDLIFNLVQ